MEIDQKLTKATILILLLWILAQIIVIILFWDAPQSSDPGAYIRLAVDTFQNNEWYPMRKHIYSSYIWAPGLVNYFILQMKLFKSINPNMIFNLAMNVFIVGVVYHLAERFFDKRTAYLSVIIWCLLYSNLMIVSPAGTELPFLFFSLAAFCLTLSKRIYLFALAGILFAVANWIRPLAIIFVLSSLVYMLFYRLKPRYFAMLIIPLILTVFTIGKLSENKLGYFIFQSSTSGANLIMTANNNAYGGVATSIFLDSTNIAFIRGVENYTFAERDSIWKERATEWIIKNPLQYIKLYLLKFVGLYIEDSWSERPILGGSALVSSYVVDSNVPKAEFIEAVIFRILKSTVYYFVLILCIYAIVNSRKLLMGERGLLLFIPIIGTLLTNIFAVSPRYHYPLLFVIVIFAAHGISILLEKQTKKTLNVVD